MPRFAPIARPLAAAALLCAACGSSTSTDASPPDASARPETDAAADATPPMADSTPPLADAAAPPAADGPPADLAAPPPDAGGAPTDPPFPELVDVPGGRFEMGDHSGLGGEDPRHPSDELPLHVLEMAPLAVARTETTLADFARFLNAGLAAGDLEIVSGEVRRADTGEILTTTVEADPESRLRPLDGGLDVDPVSARRPASGVRYAGAIAYADWLNAAAGLPPCYAPATGEPDLSCAGYRLPTEAEWEYVAVAGRTEAYPIYPWGDTADGSRANWPASGDPYEGAAPPATTPVGFYDGSLRHRADFGWPGAAETYQTGDGRNPWGLFDLSGNVWEWTSDWYRRDYYAGSPAANPPGPTRAEASPMPDGAPYRTLRGGSFFNGEPDGHGRVSNRDPSYFRGPGDPNGPWSHVGFRLLRSRPAAP